MKTSPMINLYKQSVFAVVFAIELLCVTHFASAASVVATNPAEIVDPDDVIGNQSHANIATNYNNHSLIVWESSDLNTGLQTGSMCWQGSGQNNRGPTLPITSHTGLYQITPDVACDQSSRFVVVWCEGSPGSGYSVWCKVFQPNGSVLMNDYQVSERLSQQPCFPSVAMTKSGTFVVAWSQFTTIKQDVMIRVFTSNFHPRSLPIIANRGASTIHRFCLPDIAVTDSGDAVLVWSYNSDDTERSIARMSFNILGELNFTAMKQRYFRKAVAGEFQNRPMVSINAEGDGVACWIDVQGQAGLPSAVQASIYNHSYGFWNTPIQINTSLYAAVDRSNATVLRDGSFVCAWDAVPTGRLDRNIYYRVLHNDGTSPLNDSLLVPELTVLYQKRAALAVYEAGTEAKARITFESGHNTGPTDEDNDVYIKPLQIIY